MRFAITGTDRYIGVFNALLEAGWQPVKLFTVPVDNRIFFNRNMIEFAEKQGIGVQISRLRQDDLVDLAARGCQVLVVASYNWRIPDWRSHIPYAVNFHPSPLPTGRGPMPLVQAILDGHRSWGVTCHKLEHEFDAGDVLAQEMFPVQEGDGFDVLDLHLQLATKRLASRVADGFQELWRDAWPQGEGSYWHYWSDADRTLDFSQPIAHILRQIRAYGPYEVLALVRGMLIHVRRANGWEEAHDRTPGELFHVSGNTLLMTVLDGFIAILEWSLVGPGDRV